VSALSDAGPHAPALTKLFDKAGELVWAAGPLIKLPVLCHGTPGNGFAFLKLHALTGERKWLDRARLFAMHGIAQNERALAEYGQRKYSLWTGDLGFAVYLWNCLNATADFPILDSF
jgi:lanthionine synthetase-like protein